MTFPPASQDAPDEPAAAAAGPATTTAASAPATASAAEADSPLLTKMAIFKMKKPELEAELAKRSLDSAGSKMELVFRLVGDVEPGMNGADAAAQDQPPAAGGGKKRRPVRSPSATPRRAVRKKVGFCGKMTFLFVVVAGLLAAAQFATAHVEVRAPLGLCPVPAHPASAGTPCCAVPIDPSCCGGFAGLSQLQA